MKTSRHITVTSVTQNSRAIIEGPTFSRWVCRMNGRLFAFMVCVAGLFFATPSPPAQASDRPLPDSLTVATDSLTHEDSLALADTVQPRLRVGFFGGGIVTTAKLENVDINTRSRTGFHAGIRAEMEFGYPIYFLVEFEYAQKGIRSDYPLASGVTVEEDFHFNYLDIPILYRISIPLADRFSLSAGFGAHVSLLVSRNRFTRIADLDTVSQVRKGLQPFDFGLEGRFGGEFVLSPKWSLTADVRYLHGLQNILYLREDIPDDRSWKSRSFFFSTGIMYQLQRSIRIQEPAVATE